jgi:hypothetical protein
MLEDFVMNTVNNVANFNGQRPVIDPGDAARTAGLCPRVDVEAL